MKEQGINLTLVIFSIIFIGMCLIIPVWQSSESARINHQISAYESRISALNVQKTQVKAQIEHLTDPSYLRQFAMLDVDSNIASNI